MLLHIPELCAVLRGVEREVTFRSEVGLDAFTVVFRLACRGILELIHCWFLHRGIRESNYYILCATSKWEGIHLIDAWGQIKLTVRRRLVAFRFAARLVVRSASFDLLRRFSTYSSNSVFNFSWFLRAANSLPAAPMHAGTIRIQYITHVPVFFN